MGRIVAIGGGEIGRQGTNIETRIIDERIIALTGKSKPKVLFIPTASDDSPAYIEAFRRYYEGKLGCCTDVLLLAKPPRNLELVKSKILRADAVYVGGGNTAKMMKIWRSCGADDVLKQAYVKGIVLSGLSAGAICWFRYGSSDSRKFNNPNAGLIRVSGLGLIKTTICPHYDVEPHRKPHLKALMQTTPGVAVALDNACALEIVDDVWNILQANPSASAHKIYWKAGQIHDLPIEPSSSPRSLAELTAK